MDVADVYYRSPFGSWMRKEWHREGRITEARFKLCPKGTQALCVTRSTTTTGQYLFLESLSEMQIPSVITRSDPACGFKCA